jgi:hypothetical protein
VQKSVKSVVSGGGGGGAAAGGVCLDYSKGLVANTACKIRALFWSCNDLVFVCVC